MHELDPLGAELRFPGRKDKIYRVPLKSEGVFAELHADGHEKFSAMALEMGPVGVPVYGFRDKWSGAVIHLRAVPNCRKAVVIGHVYLDLLEEFGGKHNLI